MRFSVSLTDYERVHPNFTKVKIYVLYEGINRNNSFISKQAVLHALPSMHYIPIVGEWIERTDEDDSNFGGHGGKIEITNTEVKYVQTTRPYGVIPMDCNARWEVVEDSLTGVPKEYLVVDGYLWSGRYPEVQKIVQDGAWQSMEIEPEQANWATFKDDDGLMREVYKIEQFRFEALCILGRDESNDDFDVEPCFEDAQIQAYQFEKEKFMDDFKAMVNELKFAIQGGDEMDAKDQEVTKENITEDENVVSTEEEKAEEVEAQEVQDDEDSSSESKESAPNVIEEEGTPTATAIDAEVDYKSHALKLEAELKDMQETVDSYESRLAELTAKVEEYESNQYESELNDLVQKFSKELTDAEIEAVKEKNLSIKEMEKEFFYLVGMKKTKFSLSKSEDTAKVAVEQVNVEVADSPYGEATKYFNKK